MKWIILSWTHYYWFTAFNHSTGNKLQITCGINSTTENSITTTILETTGLSTDIVTPVPMNSTKYTNQVLTTFETDEFTSATVTNTDISVSISQTNQQQIDKGNNVYNLFTMFLIKATVVSRDSKVINLLKEIKSGLQTKTMGITSTIKGNQSNKRKT